ncbi:MAG TPA: lantibiotic dehydratase [Candidatus Saccharimonadales bacterium]|nr:lantibiotic dehydratase [Candidatus Saccharimonadales bacterium]
MKNTVKLFPYALARIAADPFTEFEKLNLRRTPRIITSLEKIQTEIDHSKETLSEDLHTFIATVADGKKRNLLIQMRRDIHNERFTFLPTQFKKTLPSTILKEINQYLILQEKKQKLLHAGEVSFEKEKKQSKKIFLKLIKKKQFYNGILLSSDTLPESLKAYLKEKEKPLPKIERSLIKYLSRMYTKPSPFSTFTSLAYATFSGEDLFASTHKDISQKSHLELNHFLFNYICGFLIQNKNIRKYLKIRLNSTLYFSDNQYVFIANNYNRESIQRINHTSALEAILHILQKKEIWTYSELTNQLLTEVFTTVSQKEMEEYIDNLLLYGFVEYDFGISGMDYDWDKKFITFIEPLIKPFPYLLDLKKMLVLLKNASKKYAQSNSKERERILRETFRQIKQTFLLLHTAAELPEKERNSFNNGMSPEEKDKKKKHKKNDELFTFEYDTTFALKPINMWYEDSTAPSQFHLATSVQETLATFSQLLSYMGPFDSCSESLLEYTDFFKRNYKETDNIDLLAFYEKYYREMKDKKKKEINKLIKIKGKRAKELLHTVDTRWRRRRANDGTIVLYNSDFTDIPQNTEHASYGSFFHLMSGSDGEPMIIVNSVIPGFGKMYSRFLVNFPGELTQTIREWNEKIEKDALLAEVTDSSVFNANLHPHLMPYQITSPGTHRTLPLEKVIAMADIEIVYRKSDNRIHLFHKKQGKEIFIFDLGFQGNGGRSGIYNFLSKFTIGSHHHIDALVKHINDKFKNKGESNVFIKPRIIYENRIVLQRKGWNIKNHALPLRQVQESDWSYLQKVETWRKKIGLPDEIFVRHTNDKPQYINFTNPFLITLFEKVIEKMKEKDMVKIEEMLPASKDLFSTNGKKYVTEFLAQWYC